MINKEKIYREMRNEIALGKLMPGERLIETQISKKFGCSRGPVREAFNRLEKEGFIDILPNQGAVVTKSSPQDIQDYYSLLEILEGKAVEWATPLLEPSDIDHLDEINNSMKNISPKDKNWVEDWVPLNIAFHRIFREKCGNEKMNWVAEQIRIRITRYRYVSFMVAVLDKYIHDHDLIIKELRRRDARKAREAMERHITRTKKVLMDFFAHMYVV